MKEYQCDGCKSRFSQPRDGMFLTCPECGSEAIFPLHSDKGPVKRTAAQRRKKRGTQLELFGKEEA